VTADLADRASELRRDGFAVDAIASRLGVSTRTAQRALAPARRDTAIDAAVDGVPAMTPEAALVAAIERQAMNDWRAAGCCSNGAIPSDGREPLVPSPSRRRRSAPGQRSTSWRVVALDNGRSIRRVRLRRWALR
jgi:hypothetical protein